MNKIYVSKQTLKSILLYFLATYWRQALKSGLYFNLNFSSSCNWKPQNSFYSHISIFIEFALWQNLASKKKGWNFLEYYFFSLNFGFILYGVVSWFLLHREV
jgi:hypothetical protein